MNVYQLFVYGSLRSGFRHPAYEYISRYFTLAGPAKVRGKLFDMGEYPAGIPDENSFIHGELYRIQKESEFAWAICQLDDYEGVLPEPNEKRLFRRQLTEVTIDGETQTAWIYWFDGSVSGKPAIHSGDALKRQD